MSHEETSVVSTLTTIKDYIRWAASRFSETEISFGQGTESPLDEAATIVLHTLHQPYNLSECYFDAVLTINEREKIITLIEKRIVERKPSAYLTYETIFAGLSFYVDERVLIPRSPIAELIGDSFHPWINEYQVSNVLDLCTGSACIAIACAYAFPEASIDAVDLSTDALEVAKINRKKHNLDDRVSLYYSDLFSELEKKSYDIIVSNPPYVSIDEWQDLPTEFHAEPEIGFKGGASGLDVVLRILAQASDYLSDHGILIIEVGSSSEVLQQNYPNVPFYWLDFDRGGDGVFLLTAKQLKEYRAVFQMTE
ncbi:MAG: 50S ribosomal protein L3 N(5)-glutamine methyltransferase [Methylococcales bacterium]|nr:50S ribosomal protein L3 N(5)-glutamine methyltransferase [Methylococcales bacterium]MCK5926455.1 50S ribosomal protein L3 N(5)-glutamine methyltransferase [Methylococcales bacterium]